MKAKSKKPLHFVWCGYGIFKGNVRMVAIRRPAKTERKKVDHRPRKWLERPIITDAP